MNPLSPHAGMDRLMVFAGNANPSLAQDAGGVAGEGAGHGLVGVHGERTGARRAGASAAPADEALFVAVVDDGLAAGEVHQGVGELVAAQQVDVVLVEQQLPAIAFSLPVGTL